MRLLILGIILSFGLIGCSRSDNGFIFQEAAFSPINTTGAHVHEFVYPKPSIRITMEILKNSADAYWLMELHDELLINENKPAVAIWGTGSRTIEITRASSPYIAKVSKPTGDNNYYKIAIERDGIVIFGFFSEFKDNKAIITYDDFRNNN